MVGASSGQLRRPTQGARQGAPTLFLASGPYWAQFEAGGPRARGVVIFIAMRSIYPRPELRREPT